LRVDVPPRWTRLLPPDRPWTLPLLTVALWLAAFALCNAHLATPVDDDTSGMMKLTETPGSLERVALWQDATSWLPVGTWPKPIIAWTVRLAMAAMFAVHALAFAAAWRARAGRAWRWIIGPVGAQAIMLLMVPSNADVFFYAISGEIANAGLNPYTTHLYEVFEHPLYPYNHWVEMTTVYGPAWTLITQAVTWVSGPEPVHAVLAFKVFLGAVAVLVAVGVYATARVLGVATGHATAAMVLVGWQPSMIIEAAGQAHNDVVMLALALAGVSLALAGAGRATRGGIVLVTLSAAVKYVSLPVLGLLALTHLERVRGPRDVARLARAWLLDAIAVAAVLVAAFGPFWTDTSILTEMVSEPGRLYTNPIWVVPAWIVRLVGEDAGEAFETASRAATQLAVVAVILVVLTRFSRSVVARSQQDPDMPQAWTRPLLGSWAAIFAVLAYLPVNAHAWYWTWPVAPIALLIAWDGRDGADRWPRQRWLGPYLALTAVLAIVYHTRIIHSG
jgi:hypothetical protein